MADLKKERMLRDMRRVITTNAISLGISSEVARLVAASVESHMDLIHGGLDTKAERNQAIRRDFDGRNHDQVCHRWGISRATLYRVLGEPTGRNSQTGPK